MILIQAIRKLALEKGLIKTYQVPVRTNGCLQEDVFVDFVAETKKHPKQAMLIFFSPATRMWKISF